MAKSAPAPAASKRCMDVMYRGPWFLRLASLVKSIEYGMPSLFRALRSRTDSSFTLRMFGCVVISFGSQWVSRDVVKYELGLWKWGGMQQMNGDGNGERELE